MCSSGTHYLWFFLSVTLVLIFFNVPSSDTRATNKSPRNRISSIETNSIQERQLPDTTNQFTDSKALKRVFLSNRTVTCNDGSKAGFYLRKSQGSRRWVVFFEGGWHCYSIESCKQRWMKLRHLMTSDKWPATRNVGGILSPSPTENPYWYNANHVIVPYCSSDSWSGTKMKPDSNGHRFMGSLIVKQVIDDLIPLGLGNYQGTELLMAGSSAGGLGVMLNLDNVKDFLQVERGLNVNVRGVSDSGWFLDREPYTTGAVAASEAVRQGWKHWNGALPKDCVTENVNEPWRCYFGHRLYNTLRAPLFVFQWLFDEAQMSADSVGAPVTPQQWDYIHEMGKALRSSLDNVTAVFAPSCIGHSVLTKRDWLDIKIDDISLAEALRCWENSGKKSQKLTKEQRLQRKRLRMEAEAKFGKRRKLSKEERELRRLKRQERRDRRRKMREERRVTAIVNAESNLLEKVPNKKRLMNKNMPKLIENENLNRRRHKSNCTNHHRHQRKQRLHSSSSSSSSHNNDCNDNKSNKILSNFNKNNHNSNKNKKISGNFNRNNNNNNNKNNNNNHRNNNKNKIDIPEPKKCTLRLLEQCSWPQCNQSCPILRNPMTGEEMKFLELLASFGLDMDGVAGALGVDMQTLTNMEHTELVRLLTQSAS
uniref:CSON003232 protein n=1 Tax=Culicoides sonorensis TaxID=179676 RepID=A0A336MQJ2_CULSO